MSNSPQPLTWLEAQQVAQVEYIFTDFDDTLTLHGRLPATTLAALYELSRAGVKVIPVTGGCAGWSDMMVRVLPVAGVISEGGGVFLQPNNSRVHYHFFSDEVAMRTRQSELLEQIQPRLEHYSQLRLTRDQAYRLTDVAIDYAQEISPPANDEKEALLAELNELGLNAKASSIHINVCQDGVDKYVMAEHVLNDFFHIPNRQFANRVMYVGDAPNDESMFAHFPLSVGVANITQHLESLTHQPAYITEAEGGVGFAELVDRILRK